MIDDHDDVDDVALTIFGSELVLHFSPYFVYVFSTTYCVIPIVPVSSSDMAVESVKRMLLALKVGSSILCPLKPITYKIQKCRHLA